MKGWQTIPMRILIAEDDPYSLLILRLMLEKEPEWQVVTAETGPEAWSKLQEGGHFDLCIFDIMMPGQTGLQLAARMREDPRFEGQPVIFCTALNDRGTVEQAAELAAAHYITKPYTREHIIRQVRRAVATGAVAGRIESTAKVAKRLDLDPGQVQEMLARLQGELARLLADPATAGTGANDFSIRINAFKGAAANLGARRLAEELASWEAARAGGTDEAGSKRVATENEYLRRYLAMAPAEPVA